MNHMVKLLLVEEIKLLKPDVPGITWACPVTYQDGDDLWLVRVTFLPAEKVFYNEAYIVRYRFKYDRSGYWTADPTFIDFAKRETSPELFPEPFLDQIKKWRERVHSKARPLRKR